MDTDAFAAWIRTRTIGEVLELTVQRQEPDAAIELVLRIPLGERVTSRP